MELSSLGASKIPSVKRNPSTRSRSSPGVRMVTASGDSPMRISSGSSTATVSLTRVFSVALRLVMEIVRTGSDVIGVCRVEAYARTLSRTELITGFLSSEEPFREIESLFYFS